MKEKGKASWRVVFPCLPNVTSRPKDVSFHHRKIASTDPSHHKHGQRRHQARKVYQKTGGGEKKDGKEAGRDVSFSTTQDDKIG